MRLFFYFVLNFVQYQTIADHWVLLNLEIYATMGFPGSSLLYSLTAQYSCNTGLDGNQDDIYEVGIPHMSSLLGH